MLDLIIKNGFCYIDNDLKDKDIGIKDGKIEEIGKIENKLKESGLTLIPLSLYFNDGKAKVEIAIARGRKNYDKRQAIAEKDAKRETQRATGRRDKGME